ncbi:hypothetical protein JW365_14450 [Gordonia sp. BP-94]|nr:hypothetical protein [Gordonia sp. BP-119]MBN0983917.1 hypothetical protein [Gordonia sp. BP-94]MBR7193804.1 hypothetical protein [Gordonia sp. SCSIO 19800]
MSQADVSLAGGPSDPTMRRLEQGLMAKPRFVTLTKLDAPLRWSPGSAARAFEGGDPVPLQDEPTTDLAPGTNDPVSSRPTRPLTPSAYGVFIRTDALAELARKVRAVDDLSSSLDEDQRVVVANLRHATDRLTRAWIIRQAEIARRDDTLADLILVLDDHLRTPPPEGESTSDSDDLNYLRWLAGYPMSMPQVRRYEARFAEFVASQSEQAD